MCNWCIMHACAPAAANNNVLYFPICLYPSSLLLSTFENVGFLASRKCSLWLCWVHKNRAATWRHRVCRCVRSCFSVLLLLLLLLLRGYSIGGTGWWWLDTNARRKRALTRAYFLQIDYSVIYNQSGVVNETQQWMWATDVCIQFPCKPATVWTNVWFYGVWLVDSFSFDKAVGDLTAVNTHSHAFFSCTERISKIKNQISQIAFCSNPSPKPRIICRQSIE